MGKKKAAHRPWALPTAPWIMSQRWCSLLFAHWPVSPEVLAPWLPRPLSLDTFEGSAWLAVTPFWMSGVRPRGLPALPGLSEFPELNLRTYIAGEKPGVHFFSLDAGNSVAVLLARKFFHLPYYRAEMSMEPFGKGVSYRSHRRAGRGRPAAFEASYEPAGEVFRSVPGTLEHFLTERYCLYAVENDRTYRTEIHHAPWPLQPARAEIGRNTLGDQISVELSERPLLHFCHRLDVRVWAPEPLEVSSAQA